MPRMNELVEQTHAPKATAAYSGEISPDETRQKLLDAIARSAFNNLRAYSNCCRSTLWAVQTHLRMPEPALLHASATLAGGIAGTGETCGAVIGGLMSIGQALGSDGYHQAERDLLARSEAENFVASFTEAVGHTRCCEVQKAIIGWTCDDDSKIQAWLEAEGPVACAGVCGVAARLAAERILQHTKPSPESEQQ